MIPAPLHLGGEALLLDPTGIVFWPARRTLIVADLHLEKGSHFATRGRFVPPYDSRETLDRLARILRRWHPARLIALGDSFHDRHGATRLGAAERALLAGLEIVWVLGNHDPCPPAGLPGTCCDTLAEGGLVFRHQARPGRVPPGELSGHFHPKARLETRCGGVTRACFVTDGQRLLLPAFGAYTGGLDAADPAIAGLFPRGARALLLGQDRLFTLPLRGGARAAGAPLHPLA